MAGPRPYFYHMDAIRALLMLLGVPYHVARIYAGGRPFAVESPDTSPVLSVLAGVLHSFRMEAFFIVAGYFAAMVLARSSAGSFLASRVVRIGVPLGICTLLFAPMGAALILAGSRHGGAITGGEVASMLARPGGWWVMHLWFLHTLLLLTLALAAAAALVRRWPPAAALAARLSAVLSALTRHRFILGGSVIATVMVGFWLLPNAIRHLTGLGLQPFAPFFDLRTAIRFLPMFGFGVALWARPDVRDWFNRREPLALPVAIAASAVFVVGEHASRFSGLMIAIGAGFAGLFWAQMLNSFAARHLDRPNPAITWLSQASYSVYLFHFPIVLLLGLVFLKVNAPPLVEFAVITTLTLALCFGIHAIIRRSRLLGFLFNGKPLRTPAAGAAL